MASTTSFWDAPFLKQLKAVAEPPIMNPKSGMGNRLRDAQRYCDRAKTLGAEPRGLDFSNLDGG